VIMAGGTTPLHWAAVRQVRYLASLNPQTAAASESVIKAMTDQAELIDSPRLSPSTPPNDLPFGTPAHNGSTCAATTRSRSLQGWRGRYSSSKAVGTTR
jgi:hypothetical protein